MKRPTTIPATPVSPCRPIAPTFCEPLEQRSMLSTTRAVDPATVELTPADVETIIAQAASQAKPGQFITVSDRDGHILGMFEVAGGMRGSRTARAFVRRIRSIKSIDNAVTAAFFESSQDAFTTRTARFIIQDHFPQPIMNAPGAPLYGVQFSSQLGSDINGRTALAISGDPGGVPLFKNGVPVGGIGVSGDGSDTAARADLALTGDQDFNGKVYQGNEEADFDEAVAQAGAKGFMAADAIRADKIFLDGLRAPFVAEKAASGKRSIRFANLVSNGLGQLIAYTDQVTGTQFFNDRTTLAGFHDYAETVFRGFSGQIRHAFHGSADGGLTKRDVSAIIGQAVKEASIIRAGIRQPVGVPAKIFVSVVDTQGNVLGSFGMTDATNFSYDVAVQKARTSVFFSSDTAAMSSRAVGFLAQAFFPPGISDTGPGPLFHVQNDLSGINPVFQTLQNIKFNAPNSTIQNGITIFPGGFPLYKDGKLVGGIGISGDGVDQDDIIAYTGSKGFRPDSSIQSNRLSSGQISSVLLATRDKFAAIGLQQPLLDAFTKRANAGFGSVRLPYVKFPRNPEV